MFKSILKTTALFALLSLTSCDNTMAKKFGGSMTVNLEKDQKLVNCSWKSNGKSDSSLWILTRPRKEGETSETYKYFEKSTFGVLEGSVTIIEK